MDNSSGHGYHILPGGNDGIADAFSTRDVWLVRYRGSEDKHGHQGSGWSDDLDRYLNSENANGQDVVVWYCGHPLTPRARRRR